LRAFQALIFWGFTVVIHEILTVVALNWQLFMK